MSSSSRHSTVTRRGISSVMSTIAGPALTTPTRLCFIVEEKYEHDAMPSVVAQALRSWGHEVDVLRPHSMLTDLGDLMPGGTGAYDAYVLKTVSSGPGLSILEAAGAAGIATVNDHRAIRLARDKAVAASRARAAGLPFPTTWFAARSALLEPGAPRPLPAGGQAQQRQLAASRSSGSTPPEELDRLDLDDSGFLLAQPYLTNPGYDVKLYNTGDEVFAAVRRSPLHPGQDVVEQLIPVTPELHALTVAVGRAFGLDIYGLDVVETPRGWVVLDVNDFPSFGKVPDVAQRLARTVLRLARRAAAAPDSTPVSSPRVRSRHGGISMNIVLLAESSTNPVLASVLARLGERHTVTVRDPQDAHHDGLPSRRPTRDHADMYLLKSRSPQAQAFARRAERARGAGGQPPRGDGRRPGPPGHGDTARPGRCPGAPDVVLPHAAPDGLRRPDPPVAAVADGGQEPHQRPRGPRPAGAGPRRPAGPAAPVGRRAGHRAGVHRQRRLRHQGLGHRQRPVSGPTRLCAGGRRQDRRRRPHRRRPARRLGPHRPARRRRPRPRPLRGRPRWSPDHGPVVIDVNAFPGFQGAHDPAESMLRFLEQHASERLVHA